MATAAKKPRGPRKPVTATILDDQIKAMEKELEKKRQQKAYIAVAEKIKKSTLVAEFKKLHAELAGAVTDIDLLAAVGKELEIKRLRITQEEPAKRAPRGTSAKAQAKKQNEEEKEQ